ncbi:MAG: cytochrome c-type biogenesis protein CcmH [Candidatus Latescibacteria bacterium]|nr:cytochrome c-type biogenesis protein CcmH [Candidatus Latescibacterota bacterium]
MKAMTGVLLLLLMVGAAAPATLEEKARELERQLIAPCCWRQPVADHLSAESDRLRGEIRALLGEGKTQEEILDFYVAQYGQAILAKPSYQGFNLLAYILPGVFLLALGGGLGWIVVKGRQRPAAALLPQEPLPSAYAAQLSQELKEMEE